uniref:Uncharacterized protein n=1 Tax=Oryza barthii TaxID=65489 RepID=A0A0D3FWN3_9ORYZ
MVIGDASAVRARVRSGDYFFFHFFPVDVDVDRLLPFVDRCGSSFFKSLYQPVTNVLSLGYRIVVPLPVCHRFDWLISWEILLLRV